MQGEKINKLKTYNNRYFLNKGIKNMKIEFSKNELKTLLELLYLGEYLFSFSENNYTEKKNKYSKLMQKIFANVEKAELKEYVERFDKNEICFSRKLDDDEDVQEIINNHENISFWMELIWRLADRDIEKKIGSEKFSGMDFSEQIEIRFEAEEVYEREFEKYGLKNLKILNTDLPF